MSVTVEIVKSLERRLDAHAQRIANLEKEPSVVLLQNDGPVDAVAENLYFPRLQVNRLGEIILALSKDNTLTKGVLVGKTEDSKSTLAIGTTWCDWEVVGPLEDYNGEATVTFKNNIASNRS